MQGDDVDPVNDGDSEEVDLGFPDELGIEGDESVAVAELPDDLAGDDDGDDADVDMGAFEDVGVDVDSIKTPRPVTRTIAARSLTWDYYPNEVAYEVLPPRPAECDECDDEGEEEEDDSNGCTCDTNDDGVPYEGTIPRRRRVTDAVDRLDAPEDIEDEDEDVPLASVYGRAVKTIETTDDFGDIDELVVRVADETGVVDVDLHPRMSPLQGYDQGDEILVTHVELTNDDVDTAFQVTGDSALIHVADAEHDVSDALTEQTALVHTEDKFENLDTKTAAQNWVADVIVDEWTIENPRGTDDMWMYIDNTDSERYGTFAGNAETYIEEILDQYLPRDSNNTHTQNEIKRRVESRTYVPEDAHAGGAPDSEARRWSVAVENGVIDLRTGALHQHDPAWRCSAKLPIEYDPSVDGLGEEWDWFLDEVTDEDADRETLLYLVAHALTRCYPNDAFFALIGPGKNGKSVWHKATRALFEPVSGSFSFKMVTGDSEFGTKPLVGNHLVVDDDATDVKAQDLGVIKNHTGGAEGQINIKDVQVSGYQNYATVVILSNDPPVFADLSDGATRRMYPIVMPHKFTSDPSDEHKDAVPEEELMERLTSEEELQGLLAAAVQYAQDMYRDGEMDVGRSEDERWELYEEYSDSIVRFWEECMTQETGARIPRSVTYEIYVQWCEHEGVDPLSAGGHNGFWGLSDSCHAVSYKRDGVYVDGERAVEHVMLTSDAMDYAPQWIKDEWQDNVSEDESTLANRLDRVTPIADLDGGYCTTEGTVISREHIDTDDGMAVKLVIEDTTHAIDVYEWCNQPSTTRGEWEPSLDGIDAGDKVQLERATLTSSRGVPKLKVGSVTSVTVSEAGPLKDIDDRHVEGDADDSVNTDEDGGEVTQAERVKTVRNVIGLLQNKSDVRGVSVDDVLSEVEDRGIGESAARNEIDRLKHQGDAYEPADGDIKLTGGD